MGELIEGPMTKRTLAIGGLYEYRLLSGTGHPKVDDGDILQLLEFAPAELPYLIIKGRNAGRRISVLSIALWPATAVDLEGVEVTPATAAGCWRWRTARKGRRAIMFEVNCELCGKARYHTYYDARGHSRRLCARCAFNEGYGPQMGSAAIFELNQATQPAATATQPAAADALPASDGDAPASDGDAPDYWEALYTCPVCGNRSARWNAEFGGYVCSTCGAEMDEEGDPGWRRRAEAAEAAETRRVAEAETRLSELEVLIPPRPAGRGSRWYLYNWVRGALALHEAATELMYQVGRARNKPLGQFAQEFAALETASRAMDLGVAPDDEELEDE